MALCYFEVEAEPYGRIVFLVYSCLVAGSFFVVNHLSTLVVDHRKVL